MMCPSIYEKNIEESACKRTPNDQGLSLKISKQANSGGCAKKGGEKGVETRDCTAHHQLPACRAIGLSGAMYHPREKERKKS
jgi:hypothetical protein